MSIAQQLLADYQDPQHVNHNDLRSLLQTCVEKCKTAGYHFDGCSTQYSFEDGSDLTISTCIGVKKSSTKTV